MVSKTISLKIFDFGAAQGEKMQKQVVYQSLGTPAPRTQHPNKMKNTYIGAKHAYIPWMVISHDHSIKKMSFKNFDF